MRNHAVDGIRGWAALIVVLAHFYKELFSQLVPELNSPFLAISFSGHLAVLIFFVLSGDALSTAFFEKYNYDSLTRLVITRYFRLTFLIAISCLAVYLLMIFNLSYNLEASEILGREDWLGSFINFSPSFTGYFRYAFYDVYYNHSAENSYNPFLWTMAIELLGSFVIFLNLCIFKRIENPIIFLLLQALFFWVFGSYVSLFILGMLLSYYRSVGVIEKLRSIAWMNNFTMILFAFSVVLISLVLTSHDSLLGHPISRLVNHNRFGLFWAGLLILLVYLNSSLNRFFSNKVSRFLGKISFPLYTIQFAVLISVTSFLIILADSHNKLNPQSVILIASCSVIITILVSCPIYLLELSYLNFIKRLYFKYFKKRETH